MSTDPLGLFAVLALAFAAGSMVAYSRLSAAIKLIVIAALALRVGGALARFSVMKGVYGIIGDSQAYYDRGLVLAEKFRRLDFTDVFTYQWWGTEFVEAVSGVVLTFIGPTILGEFFVFSLFAFLGLVAFAVAFRRMYPHADPRGYFVWLWFFPSLWFWPASVGKEALILLGLGLATLGFVGRRDHVRWIPLATGIAVMLAIRPQVAIVAIVSIILAQWLALGGRWTVGRVVQGGALLAVGMVGIYFSAGQLGVEGLDPEGMQSYLDSQTARSSNGSSIGTVGVSWAGVPLGVANVLFRPFLWEITNPTVAVTALELTVFWVIVLRRRRRVVEVLKGWRRDRLLRFALPFVLIYSAFLGMLMVNLGIIARQRIFIFPFLFLLLQVVSRGATDRAPATLSPRPAPRRAVAPEAVLAER